MAIHALWLALGFAVLTCGAELLVRGAAGIAAALRISPLVIGLTVVAFATSAPELAVAIGAALEGRPDLAIGNVVGSNIFNVLAILGVSALVAPLVVDRQLIRLDVPIMIAASVLVWLLCAGGVLGRAEGALLFVLPLAYIGWLVRQSRRENAANGADDPDAPPPRLGRDLVLAAAGLALLVLGARWLVAGASGIATALGVSELVIGLTIVAAGTSLPELATSLLASLRGQRGIAVGNVIGSNLFNLLGVLGLTAMVAPGGIPVARAALAVDIPIMVAVAVACFPIFFTRLVSRHEGATFLLLYVLYGAWLVLDARHHHLEDEFTAVILYGVLPATALVIAIAIRDGLHRRRWDGG
jgi:cation:H+ antiporter